MDPIAKVARFVSLIPHIEDSQGFKDLPDIWSTSQEFFDLSFGDYEEHAVLLCNYFKWIDREKPQLKSYVVIGTGVPEGKSIYVLRRDTVKGDLELWNASTGVGYSIIQEPYSASFLCFSISRGTKNRITDKEYTIGLKSVGCVFDENDIFFNIQKYSDPYVIDFNIDNPKAWLPFLGPNRKPIFFPNNVINTVQTPLEYEITPERFIYEKQIELEKFLQKRFQDAKISSDNRGFRWASNEINRRIYEVFPDLETFHSSFRAGASESSLYLYQRERANQMLSDIEKRFLEIMTERSFGITVNCPLESPEKVWEKVKNTDVHNIGYDNCQFVLVARMFPYPGFICSVWVYLGVIFGDHGYRTY
jgi:coiled-coil and C2 domain-containing protein 2A